jgi:glycosyltransferase involved in cell wall biosynthesis
MKVLHVYRTYYPDPPGGMQEAIRQICLSTQALGVDNTVFTLSPNPIPKVIQRPEATVVRCRSWVAPASCDLGGFDAIKTFRELVKQADVVHYLFPWPFADVLHQLAPQKPSVLTYISDIVKQKWLNVAYAPLMQSTLKSMNAIVANTPGYIDSSPVLSEPSIRARVNHIPLGIVEASYAIKPDPKVFERLNLVADEPFILFVGVLRYYKGLHALIEASRTTKGRVVLVGTGPEGAVLKAQVKQFGLTNVTFAGQVSDAEKMALIKACRAMVLPSHLRSEAFGMVLVEASMCQKPMITCEIGTGTSYVNLNNETGLIVPPESPLALSDAMNRLLTDEPLATRLGDQARKRYDELFSGGVMGRAYVELFTKIANGHSI